MKMERVLVVWLVWAAMVVVELQGLSGCLEKERMGLVELGKSINLTHLPSDYCSWVGVNCSATTGRVQRLDFVSSHRYSPIFGGDYFLNISLLLPFEELLELNLSWFGFDGLINQQDLIKLTRLETLTMTYNNLTNNVSLQAFANMKNLKYLDLSYNNMNVDLKAFANMKNLKYLDLSDNNMSVDLTGICEMKNIIELDLSDNSINGHLPSCIGNLSQLQLLDISSNHISGNIPSTIGNLSHLSSLYLLGNHFSGSFSLHFLANSSKLENLGLSSFNNDFHLETETQSWIPSFQLKNLILRRCNLNKMSNSIIPTFLLHQFEPMTIELDDNNLQDAFPYWLLQNTSKLEFLSMSNNSLIGNLILPDNLQVFSPALWFFEISKNRFQGNLPSSFGAMNQLAYLDLSFNSFSGILPKTLFANNNALSYVDLSNNLLSGEIYFNLTALPYLSMLLLSDNKFNGSIELSSRNFTLLEYLDLSNNLIFGKLSNWMIHFSYLKVLVVSNNSFEGGILDKLCHISKLDYLDISHNKLSGSIPSCFRTMSFKFLYMRNCRLSGVIPDELSIKSTLIDIDLSYNHFSPGIPPNWIYSQPSLQMLLMAGIQLEGEISTLLCGLKNIKMMDLSHNNLNGTIPSCLFKRPFWVAESQVDNSYFMPHVHTDPTYYYFLHYVYIYPTYINEITIEFTTKGTSMRFKGDILDLMNGLDLSSNKLSGQIPLQIGDSQAIHALNLSNNRLYGSIPSSISRLREIESLDLSSNNLSGEIPTEIANLNFLSIFNVSNNNLSGPIPTGGQFSNFDEQNYGGNELLCGPLIHRLCTTNSYVPTTPHDEEEDDETIFERTSFWWSFVAAYVIVFISVIIVVGINARCSRVWFGAVDAVCSKVLSVFVKRKCVLRIK